VFFITECFSVVGWARLSDVWGRRPVILLAPLGLTVSMFGFGLSRVYWSLVFFRAFQGIFNGNIGVARTALAEVSYVCHTSS
jgi:MFS family permease